MRSWLARLFGSQDSPAASAPKSASRVASMRPAHESDRRVRFIIIFPGRTGSSHLVSCLGQHPQIEVEGEKLVRLDRAAQQIYLDRLYGDERTSTARAVGFKTKLKDVVDLDAFAATLIARETRVITMLRTNRVKLAISTLNARRIHAERGRWNLVAGETKLPPLDASADEIFAMIERVEAAQREVVEFASRLPLPRLDLKYEALLTAHDATITRVETFLDVEVRPLRGSVEKATSDDLRHSVVRFEALEMRLRGTEYESELTSA